MKTAFCSPGALQVQSLPARFPRDAAAVTCPGVVRRWSRGAGASVLTPAEHGLLSTAPPVPVLCPPLGLTCGVGDPAWRGGGTGGRAKVFVRGEVWSLSLGVTLRVRKLILGYGQTMPSCLAGRAGIALLLSLICGRCLLMATH